MIHPSGVERGVISIVYVRFVHVVFFCCVLLYIINSNVLYLFTFLGILFDIMIFLLMALQAKVFDNPGFTRVCIYRFLNVNYILIYFY